MPPPLHPTRPAAIWWFEFAAAIQYDQTFIDFIKRYPAEFPSLARGLS